MSGGHLCEAEAPTEPAGETAARCAAIRPLSLRGALAPWQSVFLFKKIKSFCARAARAPYFCTDRNRGKNRRTPYGLGFRTFPNDQRDKLPFGNLYCIEVQYVPINNEDEKTFCSSVIAVRVSGGHLCEAEAPTEPAGETAARCAAIRPLSLRGALAPWQSVLLSRGIRIISRFTFGMTKS